MKEPERGSVIRYSYLWADEAARLQTEGHKERPALIIALSVIDARGSKRVYALAIAHTPPRDPTDAVEIPHAVKRALKLDANRSWIVTPEANAFVWPGPDIRIVPHSRPATAIYGRIPTALLDKAIASSLANSERKRSRVVRRTV